MPRKRVVRLSGAALVLVAMFASAAPVAAHGDHDARPVARELPAGPYRISLWEIYPDVGSSMAPHLIVVFDGAAAVPPGVDVVVTVNGALTAVLQSPTSRNALETVNAVDEQDVVAVSVAEDGQTWELDPVVIPPAPTSGLPMRELILVSIVLTAGTALWAARRTARAWRRPEARPI